MNVNAKGSIISISLVTVQFVQLNKFKCCSMYTTVCACLIKCKPLETYSPPPLPRGYSIYGTYPINRPDTSCIWLSQRYSINGPDTNCIGLRQSNPIGGPDTNVSVIQSMDLIQTVFEYVRPMTDLIQTELDLLRTYPINERAGYDYVRPNQWMNLTET